MRLLTTNGKKPFALSSAKRVSKGLV